jgi:uracil-DNA glycosylase
MQALLKEIGACTLCAERFAATETAHAPRPVLRAKPSARLLIAGQAPGMRVHRSGVPFSDPSGERLRDWLGLPTEVFYDETRVAIVPMAFCFPGYRKGADLPPPRICARTWRVRVLAALPALRFSVLIGGHAQGWHLGTKTKVTDTVADWRSQLPDAIALPHPSWRNTAWLKRNPWFEDRVLPALRARVQEVLHD